MRECHNKIWPLVLLICSILPAFAQITQTQKKSPKPDVLMRCIDVSSGEIISGVEIRLSSKPKQKWQSRSDSILHIPIQATDTIFMKKGGYADLSVGITMVNLISEMPAFDFTLAPEDPLQSRFYQKNPKVKTDYYFIHDSIAYESRIKVSFIESDFANQVRKGTQENSPFVLDVPSSHVYLRARSLNEKLRYLPK